MEVTDGHIWCAVDVSHCVLRELFHIHTRASTDVAVLQVYGVCYSL